MLTAASSHPTLHAQPITAGLSHAPCPLQRHDWDTMAARIDLQGLQRQLDSFQTKFHAWAQRTVAGAASLCDGHLGRLREFQGALTGLIL